MSSWRATYTLAAAAPCRQHAVGWERRRCGSLWFSGVLHRPPCRWHVVVPCGPPHMAHMGMEVNLMTAEPRKRERPTRPSELGPVERRPGLDHDGAVPAVPPTCRALASVHAVPAPCWIVPGVDHPRGHGGVSAVAWRDKGGEESAKKALQHFSIWWPAHGLGSLVTGGPAAASSRLSRKTSALGSPAAPPTPPAVTVPTPCSGFTLTANSDLYLTMRALARAASSLALASLPGGCRWEAYANVQCAADGSAQD